ncbi:hypothetical protein [Lysinibacillus sp. NPDC092081]|uniref:hypothetical protein n=1 Tax=Lysinibacillus sp. NPDC092081 TaxID=3364131 RepID=UPI003800056B
MTDELSGIQIPIPIEVVQKFKEASVELEEVVKEIRGTNKDTEESASVNCWVILLIS